MNDTMRNEIIAAIRKLDKLCHERKLLEDELIAFENLKRELKLRKKKTLPTIAKFTEKEAALLKLQTEHEATLLAEPLQALVDKVARDSIITNLAADAKIEKVNKSDVKLVMHFFDVLQLAYKIQAKDMLRKQMLTNQKQPYEKLKSQYNEKATEYRGMLNYLLNFYDSAASNQLKSRLVMSANPSILFPSKLPAMMQESKEAPILLATRYADDAFDDEVRRMKVAELASAKKSGKKRDNKEQGEMARETADKRTKMSKATRSASAAASAASVAKPPTANLPRAGK